MESLYLCVLTYKIYSVGFNVTISPRTHLVIVEAKHNVTRQRINAKYNSNDPELKNITRNFKLDEISDVFLYIGGPTWEADAIKYLQDLATGKLKTLDIRSTDKDIDMSPEEIEEIVAYMVNKVGYVAPHGTRYFISDAHNQYSADSAPVVAFAGGGRGRRRQTRSFPMSIMKQYIETYQWT